MARYRKKPVEIDAWQWPGVKEKSAPVKSLDGAPEWVQAAYAVDNLYFFKDRLMVRTMEGVCEVHRRNWIIMGVRGELYPCDREAFAQTYDAIGE